MPALRRKVVHDVKPDLLIAAITGAWPWRRLPVPSRVVTPGGTPMSWNPSLEPGSPDAVGVDAIETLIVPRARDLGGFEVRRALPAPKRQMVGPFIFFDQAGPAEFVTGQGIDVRPTGGP